jgi:hypothetical protein
MTIFILFCLLEFIDTMVVFNKNLTLPQPTVLTDFSQQHFGYLAGPYSYTRNINLI